MRERVARWALVGVWALGALAGCEGGGAPPPAPPALQERPVVYGADDRQEVYAHPDAALRELARRSIVVLASPGAVDRSDPARLTLRGDTLRESKRLCAGERFGEQVQGSRCSGTLIGDDLVLTAGHCVDVFDCTTRLYILGWHYEAAGEGPFFAEADVYRCAEVLTRTYSSDGLDYAIVRLDRPVGAGHGPAPVRPADAPLPLGSPLTLIGSPNGIPVKIASGGKVVGTDGVETFQATVDAFSGNSGSGIFDGAGQVVGVLVRGADDYRYPGGGCGVVNTLDALTNDGEDAVYVARALERLCATHPEEAACARPGEGTWCAPCAAAADCAAGWSCGPAAASGARSCGPMCASDAGCRSDHACGPGGVCIPRARLRCAGEVSGEVAACVGPDDLSCAAGQDVWEVDACGRPLEEVDACGADARCVQGACASRPPGDTCALAIELDPVSQRFAVDLSAYSRDVQGLCGGAGADVVYRFTVTEATMLTAFATGLDTVLHLRSSCEDPGSELGCNDDHDPPGSRGSRLEAALEPGTWSLAVDVFGADTARPVEVALSFGPAGCEDTCFGAGRCGADGVEVCVAGADGCLGWAPGEACDAGEVCLAGGACGVALPGDVCASALVIAPESQTLTGDLAAGFSAQAEGTCGGAGPEAVYTFTLERSTALRASVRGLDSVLYLRSGCADPDAEVACNDDVDRPVELGSTVLEELGPGTWSLFVDTFNEAAASDYTLELFFAPTCQDLCALGETACDDRGVRACAAQPSGCLGFGAPAPCAATTTCGRGACEATCADACDRGERRCDGLLVEGCAEAASGCLVWEPEEACGLTCEAGACRDAEGTPVKGEDARFGEVSGGSAFGGCAAAPGAGRWGGLAGAGLLAALYLAWRRRS